MHNKIALSSEKSSLPKSGCESWVSKRRRNGRHKISQVQNLVNLGLVKEEEMGHPEQNLLLRCLGGNNYQPDFGSEDFSEDKAILLCTDGFWEVFNKKEMSYLVYSKNLKKNATRAMNLAISRGGVRGDNLTFIIVRKVL